MIIDILKAIEKKIANEQKILDRTEGEVTVDWVETQAEIRIKAFFETQELILNKILKHYGYRARPAVDDIS